MNRLELLKSRAREGDLAALQQLREMGFFKERGKSSEAPSIAAEPSSHPLSYHQERLWFIDHFETGNVYASNPTYHNLPLMLHLDGTVHAPTLEHALNELVERHDLLRARFLKNDAGLYQEICPAAKLRLQVYDQPEAPFEGRLDPILQKAIAPLPLEKEPLVRAALFRGAKTGSLLVLTVHHIIADQESLRLIARELSTVYSARLVEAEPVLEPLSLTYADYVARQLGIPGETLESLLIYWRKKLRGKHEALELPTYRPRPAVHTFTAARYNLGLRPELAQALENLCHTTRHKMSVVLLSCFKILLARYSRQEKILVGIQTDGRTHPDTRCLFGPLSNLLVVCDDISGMRTFLESLAQVNKTVSQAIKYGALPFDLLVRKLGPDVDMSRTALFDVLFRYEGEPLPILNMGPAKARIVETNLGHGKYDINLALTKTGTGISGTVVYNADLFDPFSIRRMFRHYEVLLEAIVADRRQPVGAVRLLDEGERHDQLVSWNDTSAGYPGEATLPSLFEIRVNRNPESVAVKLGDSQLTYAALDVRSNRLARELAASGVFADTLVAIGLPRSTEAMIAMLAVLKAGGAYLPLDPSAPKDRIAFMVADANHPWIIASREVASKLCGYPRVIRMNAGPASLGDCPSAPPRRSLLPDHLAYCIYTSGSTGRPKGVLVSHRNVVRLLVNDRLPLRFSAADVWSLFHSFFFDFSVWEMYGPLLYGGRAVICGERETKDPALFLSLLARERVTILNQTPHAFYNLARECLESGEPKLGLTRIIFGGEALNPRLLRDWHRAYPHIELVNMYGITETTVHVTWTAIKRHEIEADLGVIGGPLPATATYLLDEALRLLPLGVAGELYIGGSGLARGFLARPELTAEVFVPNPFATRLAVGSRLYQSGDRARYRSDRWDGRRRMEYLGRRDHQVKVRGFRIEPGEIEAALLELPGVVRAVVTVHEPDPLQGREGGHRLVAYLEQRKEGARDPRLLREALALRLPAYMIPAAFVTLYTLPLTRNGKVDRHALPAPGLTLRDGRGYKAPETETEILVANLWRKLLSVDRVGVHDNFFELGGHSLLATQLASRIRDRFSIELPVRTLFENPTVEGLSRQVSLRMGSAPVGLPLQPAPASAAPVLSFAQQRLWFLDRLIDDRGAYNIFSALRVDGMVSASILRMSLHRVVRRHQTLRATFPEGSRDPEQVIAPSLELDIPVVDMAALGGTGDSGHGASAGGWKPRVLRLLAHEAGRPFDLARGPLLRLFLFRGSHEEWFLSLNMHHIVSDGWSIGILVRELVAHYRAYLQGRESPLPELPVQYTDFAWWQRKWLQGEALEKQLGYWQKQLAGIPGLLSLPTDRQRPSTQGYRGARLAFSLPEPLSRALSELAGARDVTLFMVLVAAYSLLLSRYSAQTDVPVGTPIANRPRSELEGLIGFFVNTLVLRTGLAGNPPFTELLNRVRAIALDAYANQDVPFEHIVEVLRPERDMSHNPLFQAMFVFQNVPARTVKLPGLTLSPTAVVRTAAKFDLSLVMAETETGLGGAFEYNIDLFDAATIDRINRHFQGLLAQTVEEPGRPISHFSLLSEEERRQVLVEWNPLESHRVPPVMVHRLFEGLAAQAPERTAICVAAALPDENAAGALSLPQGLTYGELDRQAELLADRLGAMGCGPESSVGLYLEGAPALVVGVLAILKCGAAFLPLDPAYPRERISFMVEDSGTRVVLTRKRLLPKLAGFSVKTVCLDTAFPFRSGKRARGAEPKPGSVPVATAKRSPTVGPDNLAYIIYTSGSMGRPKGTWLCHRGLANLTSQQIRIFEIRPGSRILQFASPSFDASVSEIMTALCSGAALCFAKGEGPLVGEPLAGFLRDRAITHVTIPPSVLANLGSPSLPTLSTLIVAGEACAGELARRWSRNRRFINAYGPTESTVCATTSLCQDAFSNPAIGRPIHGVQVFILDNRLQPQPVRIPGEIFIGGVGLARGYLGRARFTARLFVPDPFAADGYDRRGGRLYRSGDRARFRADGEIEFLGRIDDQVKIRGFRVEPGEIEAALAAHPSIREALVLVRRDSSGPDRLVGYLVGEGRGHPSRGIPDPRSLRAFLAERLPAYMLPSAFVAMDGFPLTPNGKVDRRALPSPDNESRAAQAFVPPENPLEEQLALVWARALGVARVGREDNFFELGGHSLLATRLIADIERETGRRLSLGRLFEAPTIRGMAEAIREGFVSQTESSIQVYLKLDPEHRYEPFPLTPIQQAYWLGRLGAFEMGNVSTHGYVELDRDDFAPHRFVRALNALIRRHDMLRMVVLPDGTQRILERVADYDPRTLDLRRRSKAEKERRLQAIRDEMSHQILDVGQWPLFDIRITRLDAKRFRLHIGVDALIVDGWSQRILFRDLLAFYAGKGASLPELPLSFRDYVLAENRLRESDRYARSRKYWTDRLQHLPPAPELPLAKDPTLITKPRFERLRASLGKDRWRQLKRRAAGFGITPSGLLLTAFSEVLGTWSKAPAFTLNLTLFNRHPFHPRVNDLVGDFTSLTLLEVRRDDPAPFRERARQLQSRLFQDLEHNYFGGIEVLRELARTRGEVQRTFMPVVFTSTLGFGSAENEEESEGTNRRASTAENIYGISQTSQVWLDHSASEGGGCLNLTWDAVTELFPAGLLNTMFNAYVNLLERLADRGEQWQEPSPVLLPEEALAVRAQVNATEGPLPTALLHEPFLARVAAVPGAHAVMTANRCLSYGELAARAARIAHLLRQGGAIPNQLVAVVMEKGWEQVVAVLGTLISGAAYLPIDAGLPSGRRRYLLEHGNVRLALTQSWLDASLDWPENLQRLCVDGEAPSGERVPATPIQKAGDLAYVIFTSGSTGLPKGVMIGHRAVSNTINDINRSCRIGDGDRVLALSALSFDLSVYDLFGILAVGGGLVLPEQERVKDPSHWIWLMREHRVTVWNTVPTLMHMLVEYLSDRKGEARSNLSLALLSGDWIPLELPDRMKAIWPGIRVIGLGGATEASIWSNSFDIETIRPEWKSIPYGKPLTNQRFAVLDHLLEPRPVLVSGDLYIGGEGLAAGYWRDEEKTRAAFITHPKTRERLYRTGDLARYLPDGNLEFLGREDCQVKIQGYRIELGEVEAALTKHPDIHAAVVTTSGERAHRKRLIAWLILKSHGKGDDRPGSLAQDPIARLDFKLARHGLRQVEDDRRSVPLSTAMPEDELDPYYHRQSYRTFRNDPVSFESFARLLDCLAPIRVEGKPFPKFRYPSAGDLYPVQTYLYLKPNRIEAVSAGLYYLHPEKRRLVPVSESAEFRPDHFGPVNAPVFESSAFTIFLIGKLAAIQPLYGEAARDLCLLEAGYMSQLLMTEGPLRRLGLCPIGGMSFDAVRDFFGFGEEEHLFLHGLLGGGITREQMGSLSTAGEDNQRDAGERMQLAMRAFLAEELPEYMIPSTFQTVDEWPLTANGKVDRAALEQKAISMPGRSDPANRPVSLPESDIERQIAQAWIDTLGVEQVGIDDNFFELGGHSVHIVRVHGKLVDLFGLELPLVEMFRKTTIRSLGEYIGEIKDSDSAPGTRKPIEAPSKTAPRTLRQPASRTAGIAVVGFAARFPGADDAEDFWRNLSEGVESISFFSDEELVRSGIPPGVLEKENYIKAAGILSDVDLFDAAFFGYTPKEAALIDPQHRLFLEQAWKALEHAGYDPSQYPGSIGVFAGLSMNQYLIKNVLLGTDNAAMSPLQTVIGNDKDYLPTRVSYKLDLKGPSVNVQTTCSTSLVAAHLARQSLLSGECDMALAGGVTVNLPHKSGYFYQKDAILSADGHCRAFDAQAGGAVFGSGVGLVVLKRLEDALADGDFIHGVIKGSAINNDGAGKVGFTAPAVAGQEAVIREALHSAGIPPGTIGYVETHGTATQLGDPIEITALRHAFGPGLQRNTVPIGSVKTNIGHLEAAAGVAGLLKTVLALRHQKIPPSLHFREANPQIDFENGPFFVNTELCEWPAIRVPGAESGIPRRAGVSSFGIGGTNAHMILEEAPPRERTADTGCPQLLVLSAKSRPALERMAANLAAWLQSHSEEALADIAYTLQVGRRAFSHRAVLVCKNAAGAASGLEASNSGRILTGQAASTKPRVVFMFPGQGAQYRHMGRELYQRIESFRDQVDHCARLLEHDLGFDLRALLYPEEAEPQTKAMDPTRTEFAQPALFVVEYALARLWMSWGIEPAAMIGHSIGEYVAACLAGVLSLEDALRLVAVRGKLMAEMREGAMLAVSLPESELLPLLDQSLSLAAVNAPKLCAVSGTPEAVARLEVRLAKEGGIACRRLHTSHAFHSSMVNPVLKPFAQCLRKIRFQPPRYPYLSNVTGDWITADQATDPNYWLKHLRVPVRFSRGLDVVAQQDTILLETGPGRTLCTFAALSTQKPAAALASLPHPRENRSDLEYLLTTCGRLWLGGVGPDWEKMYQGRRPLRVPLPGYPFERRRFWIEPDSRLVRSPDRQPEKRDSGPEAFPSEESDAPVAVTYPRMNLPTAYAAPRTETERALTGMWQGLFGFDLIGIDDNFFDLGGHSLLATEMASRVRDAFSLDVSLSKFFQTPTVAGLAGLIEAECRPREIGLPEITADPEERNRPFPLTDIQHAYWFGRSGLLHLGKVSTHIYNELELPGLDPDRLNAAWQRLIAHHDMLRAVFLPSGEQQVLAEVPPYRIQVLDLRGQDRPTVTGRLEALREAMSHQVLPADRWPLFDIRAVLLDGGLTRLHIGFDLLIADAWSISLISRQCARLYREPDAELAPLKVTFRDYVIAERKLTEQPFYRDMERYWLDRLASMPPGPELPLAISPDSLERHHFKRRSHRLAPVAWTRVKRRAASHGITPSGLLLTAYGWVLATWSKDPRFTVNLTLFNRLPLHPQVNRVVGDFTSTLLLSMDFSETLSFLAHARRVQEQLWRDLDHRFVNGIRVSRELARQRNLRGAILPVIFTCTLGHEHRGGDPTIFLDVDEALPAVENEGRQMQGSLPDYLGEDHLYSISQTPQVWIDHFVAERAGALSFVWDAVEALFPDGLLDDMFGAYCRLLDRLASDERFWEEEGVTLTPPEQRQLFEAVNRGSVHLGSETLHELFVNRAAHQDRAPCVLTSGHEVSYGEILRAACRLARDLRGLGVQPGYPVAVVMGKGWEQVAATLGILMSGAAYLPIDPEQPRARRDRLFEDGAVRLALTQPDLAETLEWPDPVRRVVVEREILGGILDEEPFRPVHRPDDLAYVIYTSGSTGQPKGVAVTHRAAVNTVKDINHRFEVGPEDRVLALSALSFDLSVYDLFGLLATGGAVVVPDAAGLKNPGHWLDLAVRHRVTLWNSVPALMQMMVDHLETLPKHPDLPLRLALLSGDWIPVTLPDRIKACWPEIRVVSLGGATEASIWSICYPIDAVDPKWVSIPYGKPLTNQRFHVLDGSLAPVPVWVPGDLYIGGAGLASGYWNDARKTAARFVTHPDTGERLYKTGDLGRYLPDGNIEFLGREDFQVKIRGYRIELGEIEAALARHPQVREPVVATIGDRPESLRLVAYLILEQPSGEDRSAEFREFLRSRLPDYMIPAYFVFPRSLPLNPNGKVDRKALPAPERAARDQADFVGPRTPLEAQLARIWAGQLGLESVGVHDNFFELGGDSISSIQLVVRARKSGLVFSLEGLFENPTVSGLARVVTTTGPGETGSEPENPDTGLPDTELSRERRDALLTDHGLDPAETVAVFPLSPLQMGMLYHSLTDPELGFFVIQTTCRLDGDLSVDAFRTAWSEMVRHYTVFRTAFIGLESGTPRQAVQARAPFPWLEEDWRGLSPETQGRRFRDLLHRDRVQGFELSRAPLMRLALVRLSDRGYRFMWSYHHALLDGWSVQLLLRSMFLCYTAIRNGKEFVPPPSFPYGHYIQWLGRQDKTRAAQFWRQYLAGFRTPTPLSPKQQARHRKGAELLPLSGQAELSETASAALRNLARRQQVTLNIIAQAGLAFLLERRSGTRDVVFGGVVSGRPAELDGVETIVGPLFNSLPVRVVLDGGVESGQWLKELHRAQMERERHAYIPLVDIHRWCEVSPEVPLFDTLLVFQNFQESPDDDRIEPVQGVEISAYDSLEQTIYPTMITVLPGERIALKAICDPNHFEECDIARLLDGYRLILEGIAKALSPEPCLGLRELGSVLNRERAQKNQERQKAFSAKKHQMLKRYKSEHLGARTGGKREEQGHG